MSILGSIFKKDVTEICAKRDAILNMPSLKEAFKTIKTVLIAEFSFTKPLV
jgi:hypothetical protein